MSNWLRLTLTLLLCTASLAHGHKPSDSYLNLGVEGERIEGRWDIAVRDLHEVINLDESGDGVITWREIRQSREAIFDALEASLHVSGQDTECQWQATDLRLTEHTDGPYAAILMAGQCQEVPGALTLEYQFLFDRDPSHRGLFYLRFGGVHSSVFSPSNPSITVEHGGYDRRGLFTRYLQEGAWHIWAGLDHLLFLLCLLLPAVLRRERGEWIPAPSGRRAFWGVVKIITAFTVAHAMSLTAASLDWLQLPIRWVEAAVAATIVFAAANNLTPLVRDRLWLVGFGFGLIHGAGYASVLSGLGLPTEAMVIALLGFNLGVEGGQILIAAAFMPVAFWCRKQAWYRHGVVVPGSVLAMILGGMWLISRVLDVRLEGLF